MSEVVLEVKNLVKRFGSFTAVDHISFSVKKGQVVGFLGPNGAGKTTTIQMLTSVTDIDSGSVSYFGKDFLTHREEILQKVNFASAYSTLVGRITVMENLLVFGALYRVKHAKEKIRTLCNYFQIEELLPQLYEGLSAGQKTRISLVKALMNDPEILLLDEPTASLDPDIADKTLELIENLKHEKHISILYTSHDMQEITRICDEVIFLDHGKIVAQDTPLGLTKRIPDVQLRLMFDSEKEKVVKYLSQENLTYEFPEHNRVLIKTTEKEVPGVIFGMSNHDIWITDIEVIKPTLEDVFLQIARGQVEK